MRARAADSPRNGPLILSLALCAAGLISCPSYAADDVTLIRNNFGSVGMIDMPSARMTQDGELSISGNFFENTQHYNFGFQILPWLETSFRYSGLRHFDPAFSVYYDRSFAAKFRLWDETAIFPAVAIGVDDVVGTGIYSGEYLVASKRAGDFDTSVGIGWGRLGSTALFHNPIASIFKSFDNRIQYPDIVPGSTSFNTLFHGPSAGIFGGVIWHTPFKRLSLIAEYSSDTYRVEAVSGNFRPHNQLNYGASYQISDSTTIGVDWLYGRSISGNFSFQLNPMKPQYPAKLGAEPPQVAIRSSYDQQVALQALMHQDHSLLAKGRHASTDRSTFVDALWRQSGVRDVEISGRTLVLTAGGDSGRRCIATAQIAQIFGDDIGTVIVRGSDGAKSVQCVTAAATAPAYLNIAFAHQAVPNPSREAEEIAPTIIDAAGINPGAAMRTIHADAQSQRIAIDALALTDSTAIVYYGNVHYFKESDALDRLVRILMKDTPPSIEKFRLIATANGVPQQEFDILRGPEERKFTQTGDLSLLGVPSATVITAPPMQNSVLAAADRQSYPRLSWDIFPQLRQELFDPDNPFAIQLAAAAEVSVQIMPGFSLNGEVETSIFDNFNLGRPSSSALPHVRSDFLKYFAQGKAGIGELDSEYRFRLAPSVFAIAKIGYLESMFAGGGGEVLWRPESQRWALGADVYEVWQRGFDRLLDLQDYHAFTGHLSLYYASPWHDLNFTLSAGQYLAGDRGLTFKITRRFPTGVEVGAFITKTNVSSEQFGEGSFDKGIVIRIPLGWALPIETQGQWSIDLRPVQRDGGQRLYGDATLFEETRRSSFGEIQ